MACLNEAAGAAADPQSAFAALGNRAQDAINTVIVSNERETLDLVSPFLFVLALLVLTVCIIKAPLHYQWLKRFRPTWHSFCRLHRSRYVPFPETKPKTGKIMEQVKRCEKA
jgi:hypothetical protein